MATGEGPPWHAASTQAAREYFGTSPNGLSESEAARRLKEHGANSLPAAKPRNMFVRFLAQFNNLLIYVLLVAAIVTAALGHAVDAAVILLVVVVNAIVGLVQEGRAERAIDAIRGMLMPRASVVRDGRRVTVDAAALVPGDIVLLEAGDRVPADLRLSHARSLKIEEAALTGESVPVDKSPAPVAADAALGDRTSMAFSGTLVAAGQGTGIAVATGAQTEIGRVSALIESVEALRTPLVRQMDSFARRLTVAILAVSAAVFAFGVLVQGAPAGETFLALVGVAVAAIPEGLPAVVTITLAIGVQRMAARNAIIRRLPAVESLGAVSVICSDKTGTLTRNEMIVRSVATPSGDYEVTGIGYEPRGAIRSGGREADPCAHPGLAGLVRAAILCNDASLRETEAGWVVDGDPMEGALLALAIKAGEDPSLARSRMPRIDAIPFDAAHRFMATLHRGNGDPAGIIYVKGAPERVLAMCRCQRTGLGDAPLDPESWEERLQQLASQGQRLLALAAKSAGAADSPLSVAETESGFVLLGVVGLIDPPREEAIAAVRDCLAAGIRVKMITGDHAATARAIAAQVGLRNVTRVATGHDLDRLSEAELRPIAREVDIFARTSPEHKLRLVKALQAEGDVVAMTGDGVNDAPALKRADIGVAMGQKGTEAAKEAAAMVLADDNFASIAAAVREGRTVYDNLRKTIAWTLPTNGGESLTVIAAILFGFTLPMTPVQILWINMATTVTLGLTLAFEPGEPDLMRRPPRRPDEPLIAGFLVWRIVFVSLLFMAGAFGVFAWARQRGLPLEDTRTLVVNTVVIFEIFYLFSVRYQRSTSLTWQGVFGTPAVLMGVGAVMALQLAFTYLPVLQRLFDTRPVALWDGAVIVGLGVLLLVAVELEKLLRRFLGLPRPAVHGPGQSGRA